MLVIALVFVSRFGRGSVKNVVARYRRILCKAMGSCHYNNVSFPRSQVLVLLTYIYVLVSKQTKTTKN